MLHDLHNIKLIANQFMADAVYIQTFVPKSKRRRIQKKCKKRYTKISHYEPWRKVFFIERNIVIGHPVIIEQIKEAMEKDDNKKMFSM